jgi:hypothetical protein
LGDKARSKVSMSNIKLLNEVFKIDNCDEFVSELYGYLIDKINSHQELNDVEEVAYLLLSMKLDIEMEGFVDLFHQLYSLRECFVVEQSLRKFGLHKLADLFSEAKRIFINGNNNLTQEEYEQIDPFLLGKTQSHRFGEIGDLILAENSEIYKIPDYVCDFIKSKRTILLKEHDS